MSSPSRRPPAAGRVAVALPLLLSACRGEQVAGSAILWGDGKPVADLPIVAVPAVRDGATRPSVRATSDADGRYTLKGLAFGIPYEVSCAREGWTCTTARIHVREDGIDGLPLKISAHALPDVHYAIVDAATGSPIPGAVVTLDGRAAPAGPEATFSAVSVAKPEVDVKVTAPGWLDAEWTAKIPTEPPFRLEETVALWRPLPAEATSARVLGSLRPGDPVAPLQPVAFADPVGWRCATATETTCEPRVSYPVTPDTPRLTLEQLDAAPSAFRWRMLLVREAEGRQPRGSFRRDWLMSRVFEARNDLPGPPDQWKSDDGWGPPTVPVSQPHGGWIGVGKWAWKPDVGLTVFQAFDTLPDHVVHDTFTTDDGHVVRVAAPPAGWSAVTFPETGIWALVDVVGSAPTTGDLYVVHAAP
jgi:hypothetical protein